MKPLCIPDAAYLAGLIDGEGCISVTRTRNSANGKGCKRGFAYRASICITMTDIACLRWAHDITGVGNICPKKTTGINHKDAWGWNVWSREPAALARAILPFLKLKRLQAERLVAFQEMMRQPGSKGLSDSEWNARESIYNEFRLMNFRGVRI